MRAFIRANFVLSVAAAVGLVIFIVLFDRAFCSGVRPQPFDAAQITKRAVEYARVEGWQVASSRARSIPIEGDDWHAAKKAAEYGHQPVPDRETLPDPMWETTLIPRFDAMLNGLATMTPPDPVINIESTPAGEVVQYIEVTTPINAGSFTNQNRNRELPFHEVNIDQLFEVPPEARATLTDERRVSVLSAASDFLTRHGYPLMGDPTSITVRTGNKDVWIAYLLWERPGPVGLLDTVRMVVYGDRVALYKHDVRSEKPVPQPTGIDWFQVITSTLPGLMLVLSGALVGVAVIFRWRQGELELRSAVFVFCGVSLISTIFFLGSIGFMLALTAQSAGFTLAWMYLIQFVISLPVGTVLITLVIAGCWAAGESQAYLAWPRQQIRPFSMLLRGDARGAAAAAPIAAGYLLAFTGLGVAVLLGLVIPESPVASIAPLTGLMYWPVSITPAIQGLSSGLTSTIAAGIFAMTYIKLLTRRVWLAVLVGGLYFVSLRTQLTAFQLFPDGSMYSIALFVLFAIVLAAAFVRYGPVATFTAVYAYIVFITAYPILLTGNTGNLQSGGLAIALGFAPALVGLYGALRPRQDPNQAMPTHVRRALARMRIGEEFDVARRVQSQLLPEKAPVIDGLDIAGVCVPANEVGGDYFDYFPLDNGRFGVAVGDVSGKGVGAAIYMTLTKSYMVTQSTRGIDPAGVLGRVNWHLRRNLARGTFVTMAYAVFDPSKRTVAYSRAGHNPPLHLKRDGEGDFLSAPGVALGAASSSTFQTVTRNETVTLDPGDLVLLYTDGVTEAMDLRSDEYGEERLVILAKRLAAAGAPASAVVDSILADVRAFAGRASQHDDITIVAVRVAE